MTENKIDTFYIRYYNNTIMIEDYEIILDAVFNMIGRMESSKDAKEIILFLY